MTYQKQETNNQTMIISKDLELKIYRMCNQSPNLEWSGVLFYEVVEGTITKDLTLKAVDFLLLDIGNSGSTEFNESPEIVGYICDNNLFGYQQGLIHSHHTMSTFFSGTDIATLNTEGKDRTHFVSMIVNNKMDISVKITYQEIITSVRQNIKINTFNDQSIDSNNEESTQVEVKHTAMVVCYEDEIRKELTLKVSNIRAENAKKLAVNTAVNTSANTIPLKLHGSEADPFNRYSIHSKTAAEIDAEEEERLRQLEELADVPVDSTVVGNIEDVECSTLPYEVLHQCSIDEGILNDVLFKILTCSITINSRSTIDITKWINSMDTTMINEFKEIDNFEEFMGMHIEYILNDYITVLPIDIESPVLVYVDDYPAIFAFHLLEKLGVLPLNKYTKIIKEILESYIND